jgi:hypothetical protein|uniref:Cuticle collagen 2C-like n=1 Tax=Castor canadensis TaxID=51338 RepID=A0A8B7UAU6_CASCN|nr:cuticle collagen 2C-like [Castor canadensis]
MPAANSAARIHKCGPWGPWSPCRPHSRGPRTQLPSQPGDPRACRWVPGDAPSTPARAPRVPLSLSVPGRRGRRPRREGEPGLGPPGTARGAHVSPQGGREAGGGCGRTSRTAWRLEAWAPGGGCEAGREVRQAGLGRGLQGSLGPARPAPPPSFATGGGRGRTAHAPAPRAPLPRGPHSHGAHRPAAGALPAALATYRGDRAGTGGPPG